MLKVRIPTQQRLVLDAVPWERYSRLLRSFSDRHLRLTYDRGVLEIMTLSHAHERLSRFLGRLVITLTEELNLPIAEGGSTTFRKRRKQKGLEPDNCYWIAHEADVRDKTKIDLRVDPPPDLAIEVDITHSSLDRMRIYASLGVPEVWRYDEQGLTFWSLAANGKYEPAPVSRSFTLAISPADLTPFIDLRGQMDVNAIIRKLRTWIQGRPAV